MTPATFEGQNTEFRAPNDLDESQVMTIPAYAGRIRGGNLDGAPVVVVAWTPSPEELKDLIDGKPIFLSCVGGLPPHVLTTSFEAAINLG